MWVVGKAQSVTESGVKAIGALGVKLLGEATRLGEAYSVWMVGSGRYFFASHR